MDEQVNKSLNSILT